MKRLLLYLAAFPLWVACNPVFYSPSSQHIPLLTEKNEFRASASYITAESTESMAVKAAYAVSPRWALMGGGSSHFRGETSPTTSSGGGGYVEAGGGYFTKVSQKFVYETYGLLGFGSMDNRFPQSVANYPNTNGRIKANVLSLALQPSIGFKSRYFEAALSTRTSLINYGKVRGDLVTQNVDQQSPSSQQEYLAERRNNFLLEPALTLRGGLQFLKLELQTGVSVNLSHPNFPQDASWVSMGLVYSPKK